MCDGGSSGGCVWGDADLQGLFCEVGCAETLRLNKAAQAAHQDLCAWQILFRSLLPGSGPMHIPLSLPPATEGLVLSAARDRDLHCDIQLRGHWPITWSNPGILAYFEKCSLSLFLHTEEVPIHWIFHWLEMSYQTGTIILTVEQSLNYFLVK